MEIDITNLQPHQVVLDDIAHHLTNINRFGGSLDFYYHYSVAEHSVRIAEYIMHDKGRDDSTRTRLARIALLHDATETYLGDLPSYLKPLLPDYKALEEKVQQVIFNRFNIEYTKSDMTTLKTLDKSIAINEARTFVPQHFDKFLKHTEHKPLYDGKLRYRRVHPGTGSKQSVYLAFLELANILGVW
jgi:5'-deoxynucleotidase YfbR-like HD superfamily hydrolase